MNSVDLFIAQTDHPLLGQRPVAKEVVFLLRIYPRITPKTLMRTLTMIGMPAHLEAALDFAGILITDGWLVHALTPVAGRGMSAVNAYEPTDKARAIGDK